MQADLHFSISVQNSNLQCFLLNVYNQSNSESLRSHGIVLNQPAFYFFCGGSFSFSLLYQMKYFHHVICFLSYHSSLLLPVMNTPLIAYPVNTCVVTPILSFYALKELTAKRHKNNILTYIKYLCYHNSYYLILCPFVTSVLGNLCINTCLK